MNHGEYIKTMPESELVRQYELSNQAAKEHLEAASIISHELASRGLKAMSKQDVDYMPADRQEAIDSARQQVASVYDDYVSPEVTED